MNLLFNSTQIKSVGLSHGQIITTLYSPCYITPRLRKGNKTRSKSPFYPPFGKAQLQKTNVCYKKTCSSAKLNSFLVKAAKKPFFNFTFDKGRLKSLVSWTLENYGEYKTVELLEQLKKTGFEYATKAGISLGVEDLKIPPKKASLLLEAEKLTRLTVHQYQRGDITAVERFKRLIDTWHRTSEQLKQEVIFYFEETDILNPVYMMAFSGARGNISQVRQLVGMRGLMSDPQGQIIDYPIRSNFREGLTLTEYIISSYGSRKGIVDTALRTANAGYLTRRLVDVAQHVIVAHFDCKTQKGIFLTEMKEGNKTILSLQNRLIGRVLARDVYKKAITVSKTSGTPSDSNSPVNTLEESNKGKLVATRNTEITSMLALEISKATNKAFVRSALTCNTTKLICQLCYGWSLAQGKLVSVGETVGVIAAQSIGEPGTQLTMRTFHTGGVFAGDISDEIRAPYDAFVEYTHSIPGTLIRTLDGKIAFLTKSDGTLILKNKKNDLDVKKYKIPGYTILFIRNGADVVKKQVVAQITNISAQPSMRDTAEYTIKSELEGLFYSKNIDLEKKVIGPKPKLAGIKKDVVLVDNKSMKIDLQSKNWCFAWVLSGKRYETPFFAKLFPITGDYITPNTIMTQNKWMSHFMGSLPVNPGYNSMHVKASISKYLENKATVDIYRTLRKQKNLLTSKGAFDGSLLTKQNSSNKEKSLVALAVAKATLPIQLKKDLLSFNPEKIQYKKVGYFFYQSHVLNFFKEPLEIKCYTKGVYVTARFTRSKSPFYRGLLQSPVNPEVLRVFPTVEPLPLSTSHLIKGFYFAPVALNATHKAQSLKSRKTTDVLLEWRSTLPKAKAPVFLPSLKPQGPSFVGYHLCDHGKKTKLQITAAFCKAVFAKILNNTYKQTLFGSSLAQAKASKFTKKQETTIPVYSPKVASLGQQEPSANLTENQMKTGSHTTFGEPGVQMKHHTGFSQNNTKALLNQLQPKFSRSKPSFMQLKNAVRNPVLLKSVSGLRELAETRLFGPLQFLKIKQQYNVLNKKDLSLKNQKATLVDKIKTKTSTEKSHLVKQNLNNLNTGSVALATAKATIGSLEVDPLTRLKQKILAASPADLDRFPLQTEQNKRTKNKPMVSFEFCNSRKKQLGNSLIMKHFTSQGFSPTYRLINSTKLAKGLKLNGQVPLGAFVRVKNANKKRSLLSHVQYQKELTTKNNQLLHNQIKNVAGRASVLNKGSLGQTQAQTFQSVYHLISNDLKLIETKNSSKNPQLLPVIITTRKKGSKRGVIKNNTVPLVNKKTKNHILRLPLRNKTKVISDMIQNENIDTLAIKVKLLKNVPVKNNNVINKVRNYLQINKKLKNQQKSINLYNKKIVLNINHLSSMCFYTYTKTKNKSSILNFKNAVRFLNQLKTVYWSISIDSLYMANFFASKYKLKKRKLQKPKNRRFYRLGVILKNQGDFRAAKSTLSFGQGFKFASSYQSHGRSKVPLWGINTSKVIPSNNRINTITARFNNSLPVGVYRPLYPPFGGGLSHNKETHHANDGYHHLHQTNTPRKNVILGFHRKQFYSCYISIYNKLNSTVYLNFKEQKTKVKFGNTEGYGGSFSPTKTTVSPKGGPLSRTTDAFLRQRKHFVQFQHSKKKDVRFSVTSPKVPGALATPFGDLIRDVKATSLNCFIKYLQKQPVVSDTNTSFICKPLITDLTPTKKMDSAVTTYLPGTFIKNTIFHHSMIQQNTLRVNNPLTPRLTGSYYNRGLLVEKGVLGSVDSKGQLKNRTIWVQNKKPRFLPTNSLLGTDNIKKDSLRKVVVIDGDPSGQVSVAKRGSVVNARTKLALTTPTGVHPIKGQPLHYLMYNGLKNSLSFDPQQHKKALLKTTNKKYLNRDMCLCFIPLNKQLPAVFSSNQYHKNVILLKRSNNNSGSLKPPAFLNKQKQTLNLFPKTPNIDLLVKQLYSQTNESQNSSFLYNSLNQKVPKQRSVGSFSYSLKGVRAKFSPLQRLPDYSPLYGELLGSKANKKMAIKDDKDQVVHLFSYKIPAFFDFKFRTPTYGFKNKLAFFVSKKINTLSDEHANLALDQQKAEIKSWYYSPFTRRLKGVNGLVLSNSFSKNILENVAFTARFIKKDCKIILNQPCVTIGLGFDTFVANSKTSVHLKVRRQTCAKTNYLSPFEGELLSSKKIKKYVEENPFSDLETGLRALYVKHKKRTVSLNLDDKVRIALFEFYLEKNKLNTKKFKSSTPDHTGSNKLTKTECDSRSPFYGAKTTWHHSSSNTNAERAKKMGVKPGARFNLIVTKKDLICFDLTENINKGATPFGEPQNIQMDKNIISLISGTNFSLAYANSGLLNQKKLKLWELNKELHFNKLNNIHTISLEKTIKRALNRSTHSKTTGTLKESKDPNQASITLWLFKKVLPFTNIQQKKISNRKWPILLRMKVLSKFSPATVRLTDRPNVANLPKKYSTEAHWFQVKKKYTWATLIAKSYFSKNRVGSFFFKGNPFLELDIPFERQAAVQNQIKSKPQKQANFKYRFIENNCLEKGIQGRLKAFNLPNLNVSTVDKGAVCSSETLSQLHYLALLTARNNNFLGRPRCYFEMKPEKHIYRYIIETTFLEQQKQQNDYITPRFTGSKNAVSKVTCRLQPSPDNSPLYGELLGSVYSPFFTGCYIALALSKATGINQGVIKTGSKQEIIRTESKPGMLERSVPIVYVYHTTKGKTEKSGATYPSTPTQVSSLTQPCFLRSLGSLRPDAFVSINYKWKVHYSSFDVALTNVGSFSSPKGVPAVWLVNKKAGMDSQGAFGLNSEQTKYNVRSVPTFANVINVLNNVGNFLRVNSKRNNVSAKLINNNVDVAVTVRLIPLKGKDSINVKMQDFDSDIRLPKANNSEDGLKTYNKQVIKKSGQLIHMNKNKLTIRIGQPIFISPRSIIHSYHGDFVSFKTPVITLTYQQLKTGDIVQGIPKIEQLFEARTTKRGRVFRDNLTNLLTGLFLKYYVKSSYILKKNIQLLDLESPSSTLTNDFAPDYLSQGEKLTNNMDPSLNKTIFLAMALKWAVKQSFYKIQQIIVDGILRVYRSQGVSIADKHVEIVVKQMTSKVRIINSNATKFNEYAFSLTDTNDSNNGDLQNLLLETLVDNNLEGPAGLFPGEIVDLDFVENINAFLLQNRQVSNSFGVETAQNRSLAIEPIKYEPIVLGITRASLEVDSFLSASSFQQTTRVLSQAALYKKKDFLKGLKESILVGNLIPAGTGYLIAQNL